MGLWPLSHDTHLAMTPVTFDLLLSGSNDNVTAILVFLRSVSTLEQVFCDGRQKHAAASTVYGSRRGQARSMVAQSEDELKDTY